MMYTYPQPLGFEIRSLLNLSRRRLHESRLLSYLWPTSCYKHSRLQPNFMSAETTPTYFSRSHNKRVWEGLRHFTCRRKAHLISCENCGSWIVPEYVCVTCNTDREAQERRKKEEEKPKKS